MINELTMMIRIAALTNFKLFILIQILDGPYYLCRIKNITYKNTAYAYLSPAYIRENLKKVTG
jgi:hypothetical protein